MLSSRKPELVRPGYPGLPGGGGLFGVSHMILWCIAYEEHYEKGTILEIAFGKIWARWGFQVADSAGVYVGLARFTIL